ncbi:MAG: BACON domain-containing protein, partial [Bacteroidales bacterium]|nr:BACON domain-containing protein [Bacteroidales bacterium]
MNTKTVVSAMLSLLAILSSCQREGGITTAPQRVSIEDADSFGAKALKFSSSESSQTISIQTTGGEWHAYIPSGVDWLELNPSSGKTSGKTDIQVTVEKNSGFAERKANISFIADGIEQKGLLTVIQNKLYYIDLTLLNPVVNKNGGTFNIGVSCNSRWSYSIDEEGMSWLTVDSAES